MPLRPSTSPAECSSIPVPCPPDAVAPSALQTALAQPDCLSQSSSHQTVAPAAANQVVEPAFSDTPRNCSTDTHSAVGHPSITLPAPGSNARNHTPSPWGMTGIVRTAASRVNCHETG